ncbi:MAG: M23 family metallopeptidase [Lachnospiraceae bacterium]|nr:M23 family metallopeptidase [Lachnospiraceae bacterium]
MATTKKRTSKNPVRGRILTATLSLGLLAAAGMIGMYTVGKSEQRQQEEELAQKVAEAEKAFEEAQQRQQEQEQKELEERQQTASSSTRAEFQPPKQEIQAELESDFATIEPSVDVLSPEEQAALDAEAEEAALQDAISQEAAAIVYSFSPETDKLLWPISGNILLDYSMDKTVYFETLDQYKYNPAVIIQGRVDQEVLCAADGQVTKIEESDELGTTVTVDFGSGFKGVYGQIKDVTVEEGSQVQTGLKLGVVSEPSRYYTKEGANIYFKLLKDEKPVDPMDYLQ